MNNPIIGPARRYTPVVQDSSVELLARTKREAEEEVMSLRPLFDAKESDKVWYDRDKATWYWARTRSVVRCERLDS